MPTVAELKSALDDLGVTYPKKARKAELEALHLDAIAPVAGEVDEVAEPWYWPDWAEGLKRLEELPPGLKKRHVLKRGVNGGKPSGTPPRGKRWVTGEMPAWLKTWNKEA